MTEFNKERNTKLYFTFYQLRECQEFLYKLIKSKVRNDFHSLLLYWDKS